MVIAFMQTRTEPNQVPAILFDLDGTLVDSVHQHVLAWRAALERGGIKLAVWRIHRRIGMSGGLFVNALSRETGGRLNKEEAAKIQQWHAGAYRVYQDAADLLRHLDEVDGRISQRANIT